MGQTPKRRVQNILLDKRRIACSNSNNKRCL